MLLQTSLILLLSTTESQKVYILEYHDDFSWEVSFELLWKV